MDNPNFSSEEEIRYLKQKIDAGADFVLTQLFYDVDGFLVWEKQCRSFGIVCPIIPGIMPIQAYSGFRRITNLAKIRIPAAVAEALEPIKVKRRSQNRLGNSALRYPMDTNPDIISSYG